LKLTRKEKRLIAKRINDGELTVKEAAREYGVSTKTIYRFVNNPPEDIPKRTYKPLLQSKNVVEVSKTKDAIDISAYQNMTKDELIRELILAKANELRAKKGYEVKGVGANKEFITSSNESSK